MSWRDVVDFVWPVPRQEPPKPRKREFKSAKVNRLNFGFDTMPKTVDYDLRNDLEALTTRARWLAQNDDYVRRFLKVAKNNIVGPRGIDLRAQYTNRQGEPDVHLVDAVESSWADWGMKGICEVSGRLSWVDCQGLAVEHMGRDGEICVVLQPSGPYGLQLQFMDPMSLGLRYNEVLSNQREVVMGVEIERATRKPVAFYFHVNKDNQPDTFRFDGKNYRRVPAEFVLHLFRQEYVHQTRGFSPLASAIQRLKMLNGYEEAALVAARAGAGRMGFYQNNGDQLYEGDDADSDEAPIDEFEPGTMHELPRGWDVKEFNTGWPNVDHGEYVKSVLRGIASGIGVSYNTLANDLEGVNFSSIRAGVLEDREEWKSAQQWLANHFCQPIFATWLDRALTLGLITINGQSISANRYSVLKRVTWQGRRWDWVDPLKDIQANTQAINYNLRSASDVIREQGRDPDEVFREIQRERERFSELGIEVVTNGGNSLPDAGTPDAQG